MIITCPDCHAVYPLAAGLLTDDAKALAIRLGEAPKELARAIISYLRLHKPKKRALSLKRSCEIASEILDLAFASTVEWDSLGVVSNEQRFWIGAMEVLVTKPPRDLPLANCNYLRSMVYRHAAQVEEDTRRQELDKIERDSRARESTARFGKPNDEHIVNSEFSQQLADLAKAMRVP
jgi:hypothetical protein